QDGREALVYGKPPGDPAAGFQRLVLDLASGQMRPLAPGLTTPYGSVAAVNGHAFYAMTQAGDLYRIVEVPRQGTPQPRTVLTLTWQPLWMDVDAAGRLYLTRAENRDEILRFSREGGAPTRLWTAYQFTSGEPALLPGGHLLVPTHGGRKRLSLGRPGERFRDF